MKVPALKASFNELNNLMYKSYLPGIINAALEAGVFEDLSDGPAGIPDLSAATEANERVLEALLDVLAAVQLIEKQDDQYGLSDLAREFLLRGSGANQINALKTFSGSAGPFDRLSEVLQKGPPAFNPKMWSSREAAAGMEQGARGGLLQEVVSFVRDTPGFRDCVSMCDFAGSTGYYSFALVEENRKLRSGIYDFPVVCEMAEELRKNEKHRDRVAFHPFDISEGDSFGSGYDLFFSSHFLYEFGADNTLSSFLKKVNRSMVTEGIFVSSHIAPTAVGDNYLSLAIVELMTRVTGYPTHQLSETLLKKSLSEAGFGNFRVKQLVNEAPIPTLLLSAVKIKEIQERETR